LINGLCDCHRSRMTVLAIAAPEIGCGYFQETDPRAVFAECSHYVGPVATVSQIGRVLDIAIREAIGKRGVAAIIPGDVGLHEAEAPLGLRCIAPGAPIVSPNTADLDTLAALLTASRSVTVLCSGGCAGAHDVVVASAAKLKAPVVHALREGVC